MPPPADLKVCRVCGRRLDWLEPQDGTEGTWEHSLQDADQQADHQPDPVDDTETYALYRCDFCNEDESAYILPVRSFQTLDPLGNPYASAGDWSACLGCGRLIELNQWSALIRRVNKAGEHRHPGMPMPDIAPLYRMVRKNQAGGLRPFVRPQPSQPGGSETQDGQNRATGPEKL
jgi:hypothetical protein